MLTSRFLIGGVVEILTEWIHGEVDASVDEVIEHFTRLFTAAASAAVSDPAPNAEPTADEGGTVADAALRQQSPGAVGEGIGKTRST